ncbi:hypothetical protein NliqN6_2185 [Naganishia liquefaciens]|uniref:HMG box domain-containing protein n=1 Tax=Naganishia liquefaciens TaxID=104408 RepID=A0A8H3TRF3_9TREE|nr:hypothetical protein NliqN6_2185 [Naganishia liquefaciens]
MAPHGKKKSTPSFEDVEAKRLEMVKSLTAVAEAMQLATTSVRAFLELSPGALTEDPATAALSAKKRKAADKKKAKDPNAPKRPVTGYLAYSKDHMHKLKEQNPDMPHKALVGLVTEQWNNLPEEEKKPYNDQFAAAMKEWKEETQEYKASHENGNANAAAASTSKPADADSDAEAESDDENSKSSSSSSSSSETEEAEAKEDEEEEEEEEEVEEPQPPAKRTKRDNTAATPASKKDSKSKKAEAPAETPLAKKESKSKKAAAPVPAAEETPAKKRGRKPKAA